MEEKEELNVEEPGEDEGGGGGGGGGGSPGGGGAARVRATKAATVGR
jgi:hypothetical protein